MWLHVNFIRAKNESTQICHEHFSASVFDARYIFIGSATSLGLRAQAICRYPKRDPLEMPLLYWMYMLPLWEVKALRLSDMITQTGVKSDCVTQIRGILNE